MRYYEMQHVTAEFAGERPEFWKPFWRAIVWDVEGVGYTRPSYSINSVCEHDDVRVVQAWVTGTHPGIITEHEFNRRQNEFNDLVDLYNTVTMC